ncbi:arylesterase [Spiribacter vilamensis]|nr:arylesterase [Spiribacter vilamensis]TVO61471.1 arylesterase [Spiribacter vilamensis]
MRVRLLSSNWLRVITLLIIGSMTATAAAEPRILVLGDSLSAAYNMPTESGWVARLSTDLGAQVEVVNAAISGATTASGRARLPDALDTHRPDIVIIALGGNDGLRGISLDTMRDNLVAMIGQARDADARVILAGVRLPSNYGSAFIERFRDVYREVAERTGVTLIPKLLEGVADDPSLMQSDGIHPNEQAQPIILETVRAALDPMLGSDHAALPAD